MEARESGLVRVRMRGAPRAVVHGRSCAQARECDTPKTLGNLVEIRK